MMIYNLGKNQTFSVLQIQLQVQIVQVQILTPIQIKTITNIKTT